MLFREDDWHPSVNRESGRQDLLQDSRDSQGRSEARDTQLGHPVFHPSALIVSEFCRGLTQRRVPAVHLGYKGE